MGTEALGALLAELLGPNPAAAVQLLLLLVQLLLRLLLL